MKKHLLYWLALGFVVIIGCQKELSFEGANTPAEGSLQADVTGDCLPKTVNGTYAVGTALVPTNNTIVVQVNVTKTGTYVVGTDTVNGYFFRATGTFTTLGANTVTLRGNGTPFAAGVNNFVVTFDSTVCDIQVTVISPAVFSLAGSPTSCTGAVVAGVYATTVPLTAANTVTINVNVTTIGSFNITTTYQGMTFQKSGNFTVTGPQTVVLDGTGTPTTAGANVVPITAGSSSCSFTVNVVSPGAGTLGGAPNVCAPSTVNGTYYQGTVLGATNTVDVQVNVTTAGAFGITTNSVDGFSFAFSGNLSVTGPQTVTLIGTGTPTNAGPQVFTVTLGTSTCTFTVNVLSSDYFPRTSNSNWSYEYDDNPNDTLYRNATANTITALGNPFTIFLQNDGITPPPDSSGYYRKNGGDYFEWFDFGSWFGYDNPVWGEYIMLKDNVTATTNWKTPTGGFAGTISATPVKIRFSYTILQKDVPVSFTTSTGTMNFNNVIVVEEKMEAEVTPGVWQDITSVIDYYGKSYYAKGIGLIKFEAFDSSNSLLFQQELRRYQVN